MRAFIERIRGGFSPKKEEAPLLPDEEAGERLQILVGRQKAITRGRGSVNGSEGLVRDAL
jgi:hypothetical protein